MHLRFSLSHPVAAPAEEPVSVPTAVAPVAPHVAAIPLAALVPVPPPRLQLPSASARLYDALLGVGHGRGVQLSLAQARG
jgi:hypothetical protein